MPATTRSCYRALTRAPAGLTLVFTFALLIAAPPGPLGALPVLDCEASGEEGRCVLRFGEALAFEASRSGVLEHPGGAGFTMTGNVTLRTPVASFDLLDAQLVFTASDLAPGIELYGTAGIPVGTFPFLGGSLSVNPRAALGMVGRDSLRYLLEGDEPLPLAENPGLEPLYVFFHFATGLKLDLGLAERLGLNTEEGAPDPFQYAFPGNRSLTLIVDPTDPYYYLSADARRLADAAKRDLRTAVEAAKAAWEERRRLEEEERRNEGDEGANKKKKRKKRPPRKPRKNARAQLGAFAYSHRGGIPFTPRTTWGLPEDIQEVGSFKGSVFADTTVPLGYGVQIRGPVVTHSDPLNLTYQMAGNGDVSLGFSFPGGVLGLSFPLGQATAGASISPDRALVYASGILAPNTTFLPRWFPITAAAEVKAAAYIDSRRLEETRLLFSGRFSLGLRDFIRLSGARLGKLLVIEGDLTVDANGVYLRGVTASRLHKDLVFASGCAVEVFLSATRFEDSYLRMLGDLRVGGVALGAAGEVEVSQQGVSINGSFTTPLSAIALHGALGKTGPLLAGSLTVNFATGGISNAIEAARAAVADAIAEVRRLDGEIARQRAIVEAERRETLEPLREAEARVAAARTHLDSILAQIDGKERRIAQLRREIDDWNRWYRNLPAWQKALKAAEYAAAVGRRSAEIAILTGEVAALRVSLAAARAALDAAVRALDALARAIQVLPVDLDPRVAVLLVAREAALLVLRAAEAVLEEFPAINGDFLGEVTLTLSRRGLHGDVRATFRGVEAPARVRQPERQSLGLHLRRQAREPLRAVLKPRGPAPALQPPSLRDRGHREQVEGGARTVVGGLGRLEEQALEPPAAVEGDEDPRRAPGRSRPGTGRGPGGPCRSGPP